MKILLMISSIMVLTGSFISCKSTKELEVDKIVHYVIEVDSEKAAMQLQENYQSFQIVDLQRISRSHFQYSATFTCKGNDCQSLEAQLKLDKSINKYFINGNKNDETQTTKGSKAHRTGRIGSQGGH